MMEPGRARGLEPHSPLFGTECEDRLQPFARGITAFVSPVWHRGRETTKPAGLRPSKSASDLRVSVERVTRIELAFSAWEIEKAQFSDLG